MSISPDDRDALRTNLSRLPKRCFAVLPGRDQLIEVRRGDCGYYPWDVGDGTEQLDLQDIADGINARLGVTPEQVEAMLIGSMFGWHVPGANVNEIARLMRTKQ